MTGIGKEPTGGRAGKGTGAHEEAGAGGGEQGPERRGREPGLRKAEGTITVAAAGGGISGVQGHASSLIISALPRRARDHGAGSGNANSVKQHIRLVVMREIPRIPWSEHRYGLYRKVQPVCFSCKGTCGFFAAAWGEVPEPVGPVSGLVSPFCTFPSMRRSYRPDRQARPPGSGGEGRREWATCGPG